MDLWEYSYNTGSFVRWTIVANGPGECVGTVEMFGRGPDAALCRYGILRVDLRSDYETRPIIADILEIADTYFFEAFDVNAILTKAVPAAAVRIQTLTDMGYAPYRGTLLKHGDYYIRIR